MTIVAVILALLFVFVVLLLVGAGIQWVQTYGEKRLQEAHADGYLEGRADVLEEQRRGVTSPRRPDE